MRVIAKNKWTYILDVKTDRQGVNGISIEKPFLEDRQHGIVLVSAKPDSKSQVFHLLAL